MRASRRSGGGADVLRIHAKGEDGFYIGTSPTTTRPSPSGLIRLMCEMYCSDSSFSSFEAWPKTTGCPSTRSDHSLAYTSDEVFQRPRPRCMVIDSLSKDLARHARRLEGGKPSEVVHRPLLMLARDHRGTGHILNAGIEHCRPTLPQIDQCVVPPSSEAASAGPRTEPVALSTGQRRDLGDLGKLLWGNP